LEAPAPARHVEAPAAPRIEAPAPARRVEAPAARVAPPSDVVVRRTRTTAPEPPAPRMQAVGGGAAVTVAEPAPIVAPVEQLAPVAVVAPPEPKKAKKVKEPKPPKASKPKREKQPKATKETTPRALGLKLGKGEIVETAVKGRWGIFPATFAITTYRVAVHRRFGRTRWIPLEEVRKFTAKRRALIVEASIEHFRFRTRRVDDLAVALDAALIEARRPNSHRHDAGVLQEWCDRCEIWDSHTGRIRLWLNRHPVMIVTMFFAVSAFVRVYVSPH
jgi:hypothetical protein